jgi:tol-pal system protein YbgF
MKRILTTTICLALLVSQSACLKTRAQLRGDAPDSDAQYSRPIPNQVQDVQPQGQYVIDEMKSEITRLEGRVEDLERAQKDQSAANATANQDSQKKVEGRIAELEQAQANMLEAIKKLQEQGPIADPSEILEKGRTQMEAGNYEGAIETFSPFLKNPHSKKAPKAAEEATFLRAESFFKLQKYKQAIADYSEFPEKYTKSKHMPEALYKIGVSFEALGSKDDAKGFYQLLVDKFPKSPQAKKVKSKLR